MLEPGEGTDTKKLLKLGPVETMIGPILGTMVAAVLVGLCLMGWWSVRAERTAVVSASTARIVSISQLLADSSHAMLSDGDLTATRRLLAESANQAAFEVCRIELPDGSILADMDPANATVSALPDTWEGGPATDEVTQHVDDATLTIVYPIQLPGRGTVILRVAAPTGESTWEAGMTSVVTAGIIGAILILFMFLWRPAKSRVVPYAMIREALLSLERGEVDAKALKISDAMGPEAQVWNRLVQQRDEEDRASMLERALDSAASGQTGAGSFGLIGDALWHGVVMISSARRITYANGAAAVLLKSSRDNLVSSEVNDVFDDEQVVNAIYEVIHNADGRRRTINVEHDNHGRIEALRYSIRVTGEGAGRSVLVVIEDITQNRIAEETRRNFVAQVAHELRTPLTNISLNVEAAVDDGEEDAELRGRCLNVINQETQRLAQVVNDMLSVSEIEAGSMTLRHDDIRLDDLFETIGHDFRQQAEEKQISLKFDLPPKLPVIQGDRDKLAISLHNLIGNAIKYSSAGGEVTVSITADNGKITIAIKDKGIGIDKDELEKVFDRFYRAKDSRVSEIVGTGLGLPIAREIVRRHGGDIEASSELNQGSTFTLYLPYNAEAA